MKLDLPKLSQEVRRIELRAKRAIGSELIGSYRSAFRGHGLVYADTRDYQPGDDVKTIHWKASARTSRTLVKTFDEERQLRVMIVLDISRSTAFARKHANSIAFAALIAMLAQRSNDSLGLCTFSDHIHELLPPKRSRSQFHKVIAALLEDRELAPKTDINSVLEDLRRKLKRRSVLFIISDFVSSSFDRPLHRLSLKHDVVCVLASAKEDAELPRAGMVFLRDSEGDDFRLFDTAAQVKGYSRFKEELIGTCLRTKTDLVKLTDPLVTLERLMRARAKSPNRAIVAV